MEKLEKFIKENWDATLRFQPEDDGTLIGLPRPYTVPGLGGHFPELYYWDTYFTNVGLILSDKLGYARDNVEDIAYMIEKYGYMLNGNRTVYLPQSQPPFFTCMVRDIYEQDHDKEWLRRMYHTGEKEYKFWQEKRMTPCGLNRYGREVDEDWVEHGVEGMERRLHIQCPEDPASRRDMANAYITFCESGWDTNSRFGLRPHKHAWVELNCMLYGMERNMAYFASQLGLENDWEQKAQQRKDRMNALCWNEKMGMFSDYDYENAEKTDFVSDASFYALFTGLCTEEQAAQTVKLLNRLEQPYGIAACEPREDLMHQQWDYPVGWACMHYIVIQGLTNYGYHEEAKRIAKKYADLVERNFEETGNIWERYNVVTGKVARTRENGMGALMMGWSAGIYLYAKAFLAE